MIDRGELVLWAVAPDANKAIDVVVAGEGVYNPGDLIAPGENEYFYRASIVAEKVAAVSKPDGRQAPVQSESGRFGESVLAGLVLFLGREKVAAIQEAVVGLPGVGELVTVELRTKSGLVDWVEDVVQEIWLIPGLRGFTTRELRRNCHVLEEGTKWRRFVGVGV
jgi:hypothetical protein